MRLSFDTTQAGFEVRLDSFDTTLTCPVTGLTAIEELQEALSENTSAIAVLQGHVIPRVDALELTVATPLAVDARREEGRLL